MKTKIPSYAFCSSMTSAPALFFDGGLPQ